MKQNERKERTLDFIRAVDGNLVTMQVRLQGNPDLTDLATQVQLARVNLRMARAMLENTLEVL
jgi:hypothetical protein